MDRDPVIIAAVRTPIARMGGALASVPPHYYAATVIAESISRANVQPDMIDDVVMGNVLGGGGNIARVSALKTALSLAIPGLTVDRQCGSGLNALHIAAQAIQAGDGDIYIAGGVESYSQAPYMMAKPTTLYSLQPPQFQRLKLSPREVGNPPMGITAENLAKKYEISREEQDQFARFWCKKF
ncbi:hypothetical protein GCM10025859_42060 [Alicyclobacillus fastidiosus]|nr:hypothetical protein GCM10025859_42060 [Alicyclobacillus fastidiosus]